MIAPETGAAKEPRAATIAPAFEDFAVAHSKIEVAVAAMLLARFLAHP